MIPYGRQHIDKDDIKFIIQVLKSKNLTQGPVVEIFEKKIKSYVGSKFAVAVSSCTAGLHLASYALGVKENKEVLTSPISFVATANAVKYCAGNIRFLDIDKDTINISTNLIKENLKKNKIDYIIPVHFGGLSADIKKIHKLVKNKKIIVIEDSAHALGAYHDKFNRVGSCRYSNASVFSFHPVKLITTGEGGCITTNDHNLYKRLINLRSHGIEKNEFLLKKNLSSKRNIDDIGPWYYEMQELGYHYRITDIQCALGISQLLKIRKFLKKRRMLAERYDKAFKYSKNFFPIHFNNRKLSANHLYILNINFDKIEKSRKEIMNTLKEKGIMTQVHYIPIPLHPYYKNIRTSTKDLTNAIEYYNKCLSIPLYYDLNLRQQDYIIQTINKIIG